MFTKSALILDADRTYRQILKTSLSTTEEANIGNRVGVRHEFPWHPTEEMMSVDDSWQTANQGYSA